MQFSIISLVTLALPLLVASSPAMESRNSAPACYGGQVYCDGKKSCECPPQQIFDKSKGKCCYPPMPNPSCPSGQQPYCSKSKTESCAYDAKNDYCQDNGQQSCYCAKPSEWGSQNPSHYPTQPNCQGGQSYCAEKQACECPKNKQWNPSSMQCEYLPMPEPSCGVGQKPWCGKDKSGYCQYDASNKNCADDGSKITWCCDELNILSILEGLFDL